MTSKLISLVLILSAVAVIGLFLPSHTYAGQASAGQLTLALTSSASASPAIVVVAREHGGGGMRGHGAWHGGGAWRGGIHQGRSYYGGGYYVRPYSDTYVEPYCDTVWSSDLNRWVCVSDDPDY